jgi:hypothetical protein
VIVSARGTVVQLGRKEQVAQPGGSPPANDASAARPRLTLPEAETELLSQTYAQANTILEYGSGGSTVVAAEMPNKTIYSVESDPDWVAMMRRWFDENQVPSPPKLIHVDVGPVKRWGAPSDESAQDRYSAYPLSVWDADDFVQPDAVLVDGRFRVGCLLACVFRSAMPVKVLFDDYVSRPGYHVVEKYARKVEVRGRMAMFAVTPRQIRNDELLEVIGLMQRPK